MRLKTINILMLSIITLFQDTSLASESSAQSDLFDQDSSIIHVSRPSALAASSVAVSTGFPTNDLNDRDTIVGIQLVEREASFLLHPNRDCTSILLREDRRPLDESYSYMVGGSAPPPDKNPPYLDLLKKVERISPPDELSSPLLSLIKYSLLMTRLNTLKSGAKDDTVDCMPNEPDEILAQVFLFLPTKDYIQASRVSKRFYRVARDRQVLIAHFEQITHNSNLLGRDIRIKTIAERFNSLWPITSTLEQKEVETQAFDNDFRDEVKVLWREMKFHSLMLKNAPVKLVGYEFSYFEKLIIFDIGLKDFDFDCAKEECSYETLKKLLEIEKIVSLHKTRESIIDSKFITYTDTFIPQLDLFRN